MVLRRLLLLLFLALPAQAADVFILDGSTGAGTAWNDALDDLPATLTRGNTYWIGDGTYASYTFNDAESGTTLITVRKCTAASHGTETGYVASMCDGTASWPKLTWTTGYWLFDCGTTKNTYLCLTAGAGAGSETIAIGVGISGILNNITIRGLSADCGGASGDRGFKIAGTTDLTLTNIESKNCDSDAIGISETNTRFILEHSHLGPRVFTSGVHGDMLEIFGTNSEMTVRYNFSDYDGQGIFFGGGTVDHGTWYIYGNIWEGAPNLDTSKAVTCNSTSVHTGAKLFYNNTAYGMRVALSTGNCGSGEAKNNLFIPTTFVSANSYGSWTHTHNYCKTGADVCGTEATKQVGADPMVDAANDDYRLSGATTAGDSTIGATYGTDYVGVVRGGDGTWDRGAYEYNAGAGVGCIVSLSASSLTFGNQVITTTSAAQVVTFQNTGDTACTITSIADSGTDAADFSTSHNCGASLASLATCTITVTFTPSGLGARSATVTVDTAEVGDQTVSLTGTGIAVPGTSVPINVVPPAMVILVCPIGSIHYKVVDVTVVCNC